MKNNRAQWTSKLGFILAAAGSAVGLGNIWKFPGKAFAGGGGAYLIIYLLMVILIGVPVMITEFSLGRHTQKNTVGTFRQLNKKFAWVGWAGVVCAFVILCYYSHVGGWVLSYVVSYLTDSASVMADGTAYFFNFLGYDAATGATFIPVRALVFAAIFMVLNTWILLKGVSGGIEKFNKVGMPALFIILIVLLVKVITLPGSAEGFKYMLSCDWSKVNAETLLSALGQAFYSLSLGMAIIITYGSYLGLEAKIEKNTATICALDTMVAFIAGFIIVPAIFATLGADNMGKGGMFAFSALAGVFNSMPAGWLFGALFYALLFFAALSSLISIEEGVVAFISEEWNIDRKKTIIAVSLICYLIGIVYTISQASVSITLPWIDFKGITMSAAGDWMEMLTDRLILPVCALGECIFVGWIWHAQNIIDEVEKNGVVFRTKKVYSVLIKYICPLAIAIILVYSLVTGQTIS